MFENFNFERCTRAFDCAILLREGLELLQAQMCICHSRIMHYCWVHIACVPRIIQIKILLFATQNDYSFHSISPLKFAHNSFKEFYRPCIAHISSWLNSSLPFTEQNKTRSTVPSTSKLVHVAMAKDAPESMSNLLIHRQSYAQTCTRILLMNRPTSLVKPKFRHISMHSTRTCSANLRNMERLRQS